MNEPGKAVFLSYASQDAGAAKRICDALRAAGVEVWFDQSELRGGDSWDAKIRKQIKECALFVPVISGNTNSRPEGYFRLEWKLAVDRSHLLADDHPFLFPIVIGDVTDATARVPDKFREVQWTRLRLDETPGELATRVARLLSGSQQSEAGDRRPGTESERQKRNRDRPAWLRYVFAVFGITIALIAVLKSGRQKDAGPPPPASGLPPPASSAAPAAVSEARLLAERALDMIEAIDSSADNFAAAETLIKRALELDATDGFVWAVSSRIHSGYLTRGFERGNARREAARSQAEMAVKLAPDSPEAWLALGRGIHATDAARAEEAYRHGLTLAPQDGRLLLGLGSLHRSQGRMDEALVFYEQAAARPETRALGFYDQYLVHFYSRRFAEADRCLRESIRESNSSNMVAGRAMLEVTWHGDTAAALKILNDAPTAMRGHPRVVLVTALIALMARQPEGALRALDRLPAEYINDAWFTGPKALLVGLAHLQVDRPEAARIAWGSGITVVRRRLEELPNDPESHLRLGELLAWTGQIEAALQEARAFSELTRLRLTDWTYSTVRIHAALGRADDALPMLEKLLTELPTHSSRWPLSPALLRLDPLWDKLRGDPRFQKLCEEPAAPVAARDWPKDAELKKAVSLLDGLELIPEDFRLAEEIAQRVLDRNPTDPEAITVMARVHSMWLLRGWDRSTARYQKAKATAERAIQLAPDEPEAYTALAIHLYARGAEPQRALDLAQRAVDLCPQDPRFHRMRDNCLWVANVPAGSVFSEQSYEQENEGLRKALAASRRTVELFPKDPLVRYELSRHYRDIGRWADFERVNEEVLALAPLANAFVWKARARFGLHGDLPGMKAVLDQVPARVRGIERTVYAYFLYAAFTGHTADGLAALNGMTESWMIDFDYRGPKALLTAALLELGGKKELARVQYTAALDELLRARTLNAEDAQTYVNEAWIKLGLGRADEARTALRIFNESLARPYVISPMSTWWFQAIPANLLMGERETALSLMREAATDVLAGRATIRSRLALDPRMAPFRDDPEIQALLAEPSSSAKATEDGQAGK